MVKVMMMKRSAYGCVRVCVCVRVWVCVCLCVLGEKREKTHPGEAMGMDESTLHPITL